MDAIGIGSLNVDLIFEVDDPRIIRELEPGAETCGDEISFESIMSVLERGGRLVRKSGGGSAANVMYAMTRLGMETGLLGMVGEDENGDFLLSTLEGVDVSRVRRLNYSGLCISLLSEGDRALHVLPNANDLFTVDEEDIDYLKDAKIIHMTSFVREAGLRAQLRVCREVGEEATISLDPGELYASLGLERMVDLVRCSNIMFPSEREVRMLTGLGPLEGGRRLMDMGPETVVCTIGERGALILRGRRKIRIEAVRTTVVDKTGAGDVYAAAFLCGLLRGWELEDCGRFAAIASARSISGYGRGSYPDKDLVKWFEGGL